MGIKRCSFVVLLVFFLLCSLLAESPAANVTGVVFNDINRNGVLDSGEHGLKDIRVSNGQDVVKTDSDGRYSLPIDDDTIIFVIKPGGWMVPLDKDNLPRFFYIHKPEGSPGLKYSGVAPTGPLPASVDFPLYRHKEPDKFQAVFLADTQVASVENINYLAHDIVEELAGKGYAFGVTLGDIVYDNLSLYSDLNGVIGRAGIPWYNVKGNHDSNYDAAPDQKLINETFERVFGPSYYSFDYGKVHFITLDNPNFEKGKGYSPLLTKEQMTFLKNDLALVPKDQLVVLMMHIPIIEMPDKTEVFKLLESHSHVFSISGHWHNQMNCFLGKADGWNGKEPHHHLINVTACGGWWTGAPDELGIPHATMSDGAPNGYSIVTFDKNRYSVKFKAARRPADYQMNVYAPDEVSAADVEKAEVFANVFSGSEKSKVEMRVDDGQWIPMVKVNAADPFFTALKKSEESETPPNGQKLPGPAESSHLWKGSLPKGLIPGTHLIEVQTTDIFGQVFTGRRIVNIR